MHVLKLAISSALLLTLPPPMRICKYIVICFSYFPQIFYGRLSDVLWTLMSKGMEDIHIVYTISLSLCYTCYTSIYSYNHMQSLSSIMCNSSCKMCNSSCKMCNSSCKKCNSSCKMCNSSCKKCNSSCK